MTRSIFVHPRRDLTMTESGLLFALQRASGAARKAAAAIRRLNQALRAARRLQKRS